MKPVVIIGEPRSMTSVVYDLLVKEAERHGEPFTFYEPGMLHSQIENGTVRLPYERAWQESAKEIANAFLGFSMAVGSGRPAVMKIVPCSSFVNFDPELLKSLPEETEVLWFTRDYDSGVRSFVQAWLLHRFAVTDEEQDRQVDLTSRTHDLFLPVYWYCQHKATVNRWRISAGADWTVGEGTSLAGTLSKVQRVLGLPTPLDAATSSLKKQANVLSQQSPAFTWALESAIADGRRILNSY